jgi:serine/threonine protein kinase
MKNDAIDRFLLGTANDNEQRQCEELLASPETVVDCKSTVSDDSLLKALCTERVPREDSESIRQLAGKIEQLVPRYATGANELQRLLDPATQPDDLGMIGRYRAIEFLASGGMGLVFRAIDPELNRNVCIKLLNPNHGFNAEAKSRFDREARAAARMTCERIMPVLEVGLHGDLPFLVMPMLDGMSLRTMLGIEHRISPDRAARFARQISEGLDYAHQRDVLHRDIKPDNLWVTPTDDIKLLDFGLARTSDEAPPITKAGTVLGTPSYMSPEQVTGKPLDGRSDLFSLGVVLVEMLTGQSPFQKANLFSTLMSVAGDEIQIDELDPNGEIPQGLREVVQRLMKKNPNERISSAGELIVLLDEVQSSPQRVLTNQAGSNGNRWWKTIAAGFAGFAICLGGLAIWSATDKGTLVVQTDDPNVEIKIADERVSIHDPVSNRSYEIRIGETPLPTGVYQLETNDSTGNLVFSSQTITIRRGQTAIVRVELIPPSIDIEQANTNPKPVASSSEKIEDKTPWADKSYDTMARDKFAETLANLPTRDIVDRTPANSLGTAFNVQRPAHLDGIENWSIEVAPTYQNNWSPNADRSLFAQLFATMEVRLAWIRNAAGNPLFVLPAAGSLTGIQFDNRYPNLVATTSWIGGIGELTPTFVQPANPYEISVWRLTDKHAELLYTIPSSSRNFAWDQGYRIVHAVDQHLAFFRLDDGTTHLISECLDSRLKENSVSPNGKYLATCSSSGNQQHISIHNLRTNQFVGSIPSAWNFQWKDDGNEIAASSDSNDSPIEIWRSDKPVLIKRVEFYVEGSGSSGNGSKPLSAKSLEGNFGRLAWLTIGGELTIRNLENNRQASLSIAGLKGLTQCQMAWQADGTLNIRAQ